MKKIKKKLLAVMAALSLVGTSFSPVGTFNVQAEETSTPKDLYDINIEIDCSTFKYTGEAIKYLPLYTWDDSEEDGDIENLTLGTDYKILGYAVPDGEYFDEFPEPYEDVWIEGTPKDIGNYAILIEGMGDYSGKAIVPIYIMDIYDLSQYCAESIDEYNVISYKDICLYRGYFDFEQNTTVYSYPKEGADFVFDGWCTQENYANGKRTWSTEKITNEDYYAFKFSGTGKYKGQIVGFFYVPDINNIENYYPYFSQAIKYNPNTKIYDFCLLNKYLKEGTDYTTSYCDVKTFNIEDPKNIKWIDGMPTKDSKSEDCRFVIKIEGKAPYKGVTYFEGYYYGEKNAIEVVDKDKLEINNVSAENNYNLIICPTETKEYTIKMTPTGLKENDYFYARIYDENGEYVIGFYEDTNYEEKVVLEAGKLYSIELGIYNPSSEGNDKVSYKVEISGGYKYKEPGSVETVKVDDKKPEQKAQSTTQDVFKAPAVGTKLTDKNYTYKVTKAVAKKGEVGEVEVTGLNKKSLKNIKIADKVTIDGNTYNVTSIGKNAFKGNKKVTQVTIGKNVTKIGANAFANAKKLKKVVIKSTKITKIGKKAFVRKKNAKKLTFKVNKKNKKAYKKLLKKAKTNKFVVK